MNDNKELLEELFRVADFDYRLAEHATVVEPDTNNQEPRLYELMPMLDEAKDIKKVINDVKKGWWICPF